MGRVVKIRSVKSGLPPGTLVHIGKKSDREIRITVSAYDEISCREVAVETLKECVNLADPSCVTWCWRRRRKKLRT